MDEPLCTMLCSLLDRNLPVAEISIPLPADTAVLFMQVHGLGVA